VSALLGENLHVRVLGPEVGGWKHGPIEAVDGVTVAVVAKNPFTWLESFYKWELIRERTPARTLTEFAGAPLSHLKLAAVWGATDPVDVWNKATASWVAAEHAGDVLVLRYEDVIGDIGAQLDKFTDRFPTRRRHRHPVDIESRVGPGWKTEGPVDRGRYTDPMATALDQALVALLEERLDRELLAALAYGARGDDRPLG
jgi:hypothetical protein